MVMQTFGKDESNVRIKWVHPKAPYDFNKITKRLMGVRHELYRTDGNRLSRTLTIGESIVLVQTESIGTVEAPYLKMIVCGTEDDGIADEAVRRMERVLSTGLDVRPFYQFIEQFPSLAPLSRQFYGLRILLEADPFQSLIKTIIGQQLNLAFAAELNRRLIQLASPPAVFEAGEFPVFPSTEQIARLSVDELLSLQFSRRKAEYIIGLAGMVTDRSIDFREMEDWSDEMIIERLIQIRGIGRWTAECFLLFGMGRTDALPAIDIGLRNALKLNLGLNGQPTEEEVRRLGKEWSPWASYMTFYLWESLNA